MSMSAITLIYSFFEIPPKMEFFCVGKMTKFGIKKKLIDHTFQLVGKRCKS